MDNLLPFLLMLKKQVAQHSGLMAGGMFVQARHNKLLGMMRTTRRLLSQIALQAMIW